MASVTDPAALAPYVPRLVLDWDDPGAGPSYRAIDGTLAFVDISGFTAMSERLARSGKAGAEEVTEILNSTFARLLAVAYENGGSLLKFGGDALLLFFSGPSHVERACHAAAGMRRKLREIGGIPSSSGLITLRMSVGVHSGKFDFFLVGDLQRELRVTGAAASRTGARSTFRKSSPRSAGSVFPASSAANTAPARAPRTASAGRNRMVSCRSGGRRVGIALPPAAIWALSAGLAVGVSSA